MKFSIVVPVYNAEKYIQACIDCLLCQTYDNFELILVNDGSKDGSLEILRCAERLDQRVKVINQDNTGVFQARLNGINAADGDYFLFVDADDFASENTLEVLHHAIVQHEADLVIFNYARTDEMGHVVSRMPALFEHEKVFGLQNKEELLNKIITENTLNSLCFKCMKKDYAVQINEQSAYRSVKMGEDLIQSLPALIHSKRVVYLDEVLYYYRDHQSSATHKTKVSYALDYQTVRTVVFENVVSQYPNLSGDFFKFYFLNIVLDLLLICKTFDRKTYVSAYKTIVSHPLHQRALNHLNCASRNSRLALTLCNPVFYLLCRPFAYLYFMIY